MPRFLKVTADRADDLSRIQAQAPAATPAPAADTRETTATTSTGKYVSQNPMSWDGVEHVGRGECVDLVKAATGAPRTVFWREGELVKGNPNIRPGTAIALFDKNGHYMMHAAIYIGQDEKGILFIDQWKWTDKDYKEVHYHNPIMRHLDFVYSTDPMINKGDWYHVIQ